MKRKVKSMAEILQEFPELAFNHVGAFYFYSGGAAYVPATFFHALGKEIELDEDGCYKGIFVHEYCLYPLPKKKTIKLFRYTFNMLESETRRIMQSQWVNETFSGYYGRVDHLELLKTEEKEIEIDET